MAQLDANLPFEVAIEKAKYEIANAINMIGRNYSIPSSILNVIVEQIANESKTNALEMIIAGYDISVPKGPTEGDEKPDPSEG